MSVIACHTQGSIEEITFLSTMRAKRLLVSGLDLYTVTEQLNDYKFVFSVKNWIHLISFSAVAGGLGYLAVKPYYERYYGGPKDEVINLTIKKDEPKATDIIDVEDLGEKTGFCRCWRSKKVQFYYTKFTYIFF